MAIHSQNINGHFYINILYIFKWQKCVKCYFALLHLSMGVINTLLCVHIHTCCIDIFCETWQEAPTGILQVPRCQAAEDVEILPQVLFPSLRDHGQQSDQHQHSGYQHHYVRIRLVRELGQTIFTLMIKSEIQRLKERGLNSPAHKRPSSRLAFGQIGERKETQRRGRER